MKRQWPAQLAILLILFFVSLSTSSAGAFSKKPPVSNDAPTLFVIERDTLQSRNYTPVVNHQTMIVNAGAKPLTLELSSEIPPGKYIRGNGYPAFLEESLLSDPVFSPFNVAPKKTSYLPRPHITAKGKNASFSWSGVELLPEEGIIAQYDNYFGNDSHYWTDEGFDFEGIKVRASYEAGPGKGAAAELSLSYEILNAQKEPVKDLSFGVFVPVKQILKEREIPFLELEQICSSPNVEASKIIKSDGFGEAAEGIGAGINIKELAPGKKAKFTISLAGRPATADGTIWPIVSLTGRSMRQGTWPQTIVKANAPVREERFSYLSYNLVIKDRLVFRVTNKGARIEKASQLETKRAEE